MPSEGERREYALLIFSNFVDSCDSGHPTSENGETVPGSYMEFLNNRAETETWIHESIAMFTGVAKNVTTAYFGQAPKKMYYSGCSTGGAQGFALAQFHPDLYDGIYAGSPGNHYSHLILSFLWNGVNSNVWHDPRFSPFRIDLQRRHQTHI